jgi:uncharacterized flavoprotein (TIGR03862 family)
VARLAELGIALTAVKKKVAVVGAGPAGLMAAEVLAQASPGIEVHVFDAMPSVGRKLLLAGIGGLNITHAEPLEAFVGRYGVAAEHIGPMLDAFGPQALRDWVHGLGIETFVGTSQRVFPAEMKAAPLLRRWLQRLRSQGVQFHSRHCLTGFDRTAPGVGLFFSDEIDGRSWSFDAAVLAMGGGSWPKLGSNGAWQVLLQDQGVGVAPLLPSNCGFDVTSPRTNATGWSDKLTIPHAGAPIKPVRLGWKVGSELVWRQGEFVLTQTGVEGSLIYAASAALRDQISANGSTQVWLDLLPAHTPERVRAEVAHPRGAKSLSSHLEGRLKLSKTKLALMYELLDAATIADPKLLALALKAMPLILAKTRPIEEAISSAGGVWFDSLTPGLECKAMPGVFCAGEMLEWEAPTGGYLLTACWASGYVAGQSAAKKLLN